MHYKKAFSLVTDETHRHRIVSVKLGPGWWETMLFHISNLEAPIDEKVSASYEACLIRHAETWAAITRAEGGPR